MSDFIFGKFRKATFSAGKITGNEEENRHVESKYHAIDGRISQMSQDDADHCNASGNVDILKTFSF